MAGDDGRWTQALAAIRADIEARRWANARECCDAFAVTNPDPDDATRTAFDSVRD